MNIQRWVERFEGLMEEMEMDGVDPVNVVMNMCRCYVEDCAEDSIDNSNAVIWSFDDGQDLVIALTPSEECSGTMNKQLH